MQVGRNGSGFPMTHRRLTRVKAHGRDIHRICTEAARNAGPRTVRSMSEPATTRTTTPRRPRRWLALSPALAYVLLTVHASVALASLGPTTPGAVGYAGSTAATTLREPFPAPLAPCCGEHQCKTVATAGPLLPARLEQPPRPHHDMAVAAVGARTLVPVVSATGPVPARHPHSARLLPVYLATARLRL